MFIDSKSLEDNAALAAASKMCAAARTAPKGRGIDHIFTAVLTHEDKENLAREMDRLHDEEGYPDFFARDAACVDKSKLVVLIGCRNMVRGLDCGICGHETCKECNEAGGTCNFEIIDFGIALGSAAAAAADERVDTRIMYSIGVAAKRLELLPKAAVIMGLPVSITGKSPFFDRG